MPLNERITDVDLLRAWKDKLPLHYEYTAGVAGERFLRGIKDGKILASRCRNCGKAYIPPKMYCVGCFVQIDDYREVGPVGTVEGLAESHVNFEGRRVDPGRTFAFITFKGVTGGLVHYVGGKGSKVGALVRPKFKPPEQRQGTLRDIEMFVAP
ncbi:MAG: zinc ribbon domain-containing protein [Thaumarchaeota archaeon]|nr:zinc ribbon domain-containing protein [Nitrososphaerota archaeon]